MAAADIPRDDTAEDYYSRVYNTEAAYTGNMGGGDKNVYLPTLHP